MKTYTIGRGTDAMIECGDDTVSRIHAEITLMDDGRCYIKDRDSSNGTFVWNGTRWKRIKEQTVDIDAILLLGEFEITVKQILSNIRRVMRNPETGEVVKI